MGWDGHQKEESAQANRPISSYMPLAAAQFAKAQCVCGGSSHTAATCSSAQFDKWRHEVVFS